MAVAETAKLLVDLSLKGNFASQMSKAGKAARGFDKDASRAYKAGTQIGTGIKRGAVIAAAGIGILATQVGFGLDQLIQLEDLTAQSNAALKSTGNTAGQTADSIRALAEKYESLNATVDDKVIQSGENLLLTFTKVRKDAFEPALVAALDMSKALGTDLNSAVKTVGKALSDPAKAAGRLTRAGIILTKSEQKQIAAHLKNNDTLGAQNVVLAALNKRYGGSFLAGGATTAGKVAKFGDAVEDLQKSLATALLPTVSNIADALTELLRDPEIVRGTEKLGEEIGKLFSPANIKAGVGAIKEGAGVLLEVAGTVGGIVKTAVGLFTSLPPELQKLAIAAFTVNKLTGGLVTNLAGGLISAVLSSFKGVMSVNAAVVNVNGGISGGVPGGGGGGVLGTLGKLVIPVAIAAITVEAAGAIANAIDPTATGPGKETLVNRDPRRFDQFGRVIANSIQTGLKGSLDRPSTVGPAVDSARRAAIAANKAASASLTTAEKIKGILFGGGGTDRGLDRPGTVGPAADKQRQATEKVQTAVETMRGKIADELQTVQSGVDRTKSQVSVSGSAVAAAERVGASSIVSAIYANRPITNVNVNIAATTVQRTVEVTNRYGTQIGSRGQDAFDGTRPR